MYCNPNNLLANSMLTNPKAKDNIQSKKIPPKENDNYEKYLGPGCYEINREFDKSQTGGKGNPIVTKVKRNNYIIG